MCFQVKKCFLKVKSARFYFIANTYDNGRQSRTGQHCITKPFDLHVDVSGMYHIDPKKSASLASFIDRHVSGDLYCRGFFLVFAVVGDGDGSVGRR